MLCFITSLAIVSASAASDCDGLDCIRQTGDEEATLLQVQSVREPDRVTQVAGDNHTADKAESVNEPGKLAEVCDDNFSIFPYGREETARWGTNFNGWGTCGNRSQSPINIRPWCLGTKRAEGSERLQTHYGENQEPIVFRNTGHSPGIDANFGTLQLSIGTLRAYNVHFHHPSEHTINWKAAELEMHIVHKSMEDHEEHDIHRGCGCSPSSTAVVAILFDVGRENKCLSELFSQQLPIAGCERPVGNIDLGSCFEDQLNGDWWSYSGSLTTPPCTEGLFWNVMQRRAEISREQLENFKAMFLLNARPAQDLNGRTVYSHSRK